MWVSVVSNFMKLVTIPAAMAMGIFVSGCFPINQTISPSVTGVAIDARTHAPISRAQAMVAYSHYPPPTTPEAFTNIRPPIVTTGSDGSFSIPPGKERSWFFILAPGDHFGPWSTLLVKADGYQTAVISCSTLGDAPTNVGKIFLNPK
jgi:hypothetical protein